MNINSEKIAQVIIKDKDGKVIANFKPSMFALLTMQDKTKQLVISEGKNH